MTIDPAALLKAVEIAAKRGCSGDLDFAWYDHATDTLYITPRLWDMYAHDIYHDSVIIVPYR